MCLVSAFDREQKYKLNVFDDFLDDVQLPLSYCVVTATFEFSPHMVESVSSLLISPYRDTNPIWQDSTLMTSFNLSPHTNTLKIRI